jgi:hypothetical protein
MWAAPAEGPPGAISYARRTSVHVAEWFPCEHGGKVFPFAKGISFPVWLVQRYTPLSWHFSPVFPDIAPTPVQVREHPTDYDRSAGRRKRVVPIAVPGADLPVRTMDHQLATLIPCDSTRGIDGSCLGWVSGREATIPSAANTPPVPTRNNMLVLPHGTTPSKGLASLIEAGAAVVVQRAAHITLDPLKHQLSLNFLLLAEIQHRVPTNIRARYSTKAEVTIGYSLRQGG